MMKMNIFALTVVALVAGLGSSACFAEKCNDNETEQDGNCVQLTPLTKYTGEDFVQNVPYTAGGSLYVQSVNGQVTIQQGAASTVVATFKPFTHRGSGQETEAKAEMLSNLVLQATQEGGGAKIETRTTGGSTGLGAVIALQIPPEFDGGIHVANEAGGVIVHSVSAANLVDIQSSGVGDCFVAGAASVTDTSVTCDGNISVGDISDKINIVSEDILDSTKVAVLLGQVSASSPGGSITATAGLVEFTVPSAANFTLQAQALLGGTVNLGTLPSTCIPAQTSEAAKSMTCGTGGPLYKVVAGDDMNLGNVTILYR